ncbi:L-2-hydroxyglutarate oxidase [Cryptosporangium aurantiacum]|uniref:L-2-hydroxyglutarate oxidase LhgO n=1 Tax=Cryptosporangium aurantiacum TaxID=134849 RepID=A0A1M7TWA8_9ACTN|nr:L-2-hydroxyglutarate oxidase [Cryptosporangium aurantiacum]SHN75018.1 L-2-hydroxyglutarate oxidase LhgO [Cryptosporangium aurantiacum]
MKVGIVGAGLVGLAVARRIAQQGADVVVFEKETDVSRHQSGHNSGVVHAGIYYTPGSLKATLCRRGVHLLKEFCAEHSLGYSEIGKVVVARDDVEIGRLTEIEKKAHANGVPGVRWLDAAALREIEPNVAGAAALHSPTTAIVDYVAIARAMADDVRTAGGEVRFSSPVTAIDPVGGRIRVRAGGTEVTLDQLVICAGLQSDLVAELAGDDPGPAIIPFRGEYYRLVPERADLVNGLVYPVPDPAYPFLGVHVTPRIDGTVDVGPNAVLATAREGYHRRNVNLRDLGRTLRWPGFRKLALQHWRAGIHEMRGSVSKRAFTAAARDYVPSLRTSDLVPAPAGVRAQAVDRDGSLVDDFRISTLGPVTAVRNAPSPAATSALAIAEHVVTQMHDRSNS